jgi:ubiquinone biosynthesis protein
MRYALKPIAMTTITDLKKPMAQLGKHFSKLGATLTILLTLFVGSASWGSSESGGGIPRTSLIYPSMFMENTIIKFILSSYGKSDEEKLKTLDEAQAIVKRFASQERVIHRIESKNDLAEVREIYFPTFNSLNDEVEYRRTHTPPFLLLSPADESIETLLESLITTQDRRLESLGALKSIARTTFGDTTLRQFIFKLLDRTEPASNFFNAIPDSQRLSLINVMQKSVSKALSQIDATGALIVDSGAIQHTTPGMSRFFELAIGEYFKTLDTESKLNIVARFLDQPEMLSAQEKFEVMIMSSGPQFQKLFQVYARQEGFGEQLKDIFKKLESSTRPSPWRLIKELIAKEEVPFQWISIHPRALGVGTMAQVHRAQIRLADGKTKSVVVRVMKPGIEQRLAQDSEALRRVAPIIDADPALQATNFPKITPFVNEIIAMGENELDVPATVRAQARGSLLYERTIRVKLNSTPETIRFHVPEVFEVSPKSQMMVQEFVEGTSFEKFAESEPELARTSIEELARLWVETALLGDGFFHADLHQGNIRVRRGRDHTLQVNILDFGMTGKLSSRMQSQIIGLSVVLRSQRPDYMARALWELSTPGQNTITQTELKRLIERTLNQPVSSQMSFGDWISLSANAGLKFPQEFTSLNRGMALVFQMLQNQQSPLNVADIMKSALKRNPSRLRAVVDSLDSVSRKEWFKIIFLKPTAPKALTCKDIFRSTN